MRSTNPKHIRSVALEAWVVGTLAIIMLHCMGDSVWAGKPDLYAVIIGISEYDDPRIIPVKHALDDARDVQSFVEEQQRQRKLFGRAYVKSLFDARATKENILKALKYHLTAAQRKDIVIIYIAGHGEWHTDDKRYFLPYDTDSDDIARTAILMADPGLLKHVQSERVLLVADACKSGGFLSAIGKGSNRGRFVMVAASPDENALSSPDFRNGLFTYYFLKGLRGAAVSNTKKTVITVKSLFDYVFAQTQRQQQGLEHGRRLSCTDHQTLPPQPLCILRSNSRPI